MLLALLKVDTEELLLSVRKSSLLLLLLLFLLLPKLFEFWTPGLEEAVEGWAGVSLACFRGDGQSSLPLRDRDVSEEQEEEEEMEDEDEDEDEEDTDRAALFSGWATRERPAVDAMLSAGIELACVPGALRQ